MKRQIKFRGQRRDGRKWVFGSLVTCYGATYIHELIFDLVKQERDYEVEPDTVCQYTGFTDKNGREVYEGDILTDEFGTVGVVEWQEGAFVVTVPDINVFDIDECFDESYQMCIIGNIHDTPELLKSGKEWGGNL